MSSKNVNDDKHSSSAPQTVQDGSLEEPAKKLVARPLPQAVSGIPGAVRFLAPGGGKFVLELRHSGFDIDSAIGRFTWHMVENDKFVPALFRTNGELHFCVRMIEISILGDVLKLLPPDIYALAKLDTKPVSRVEAKLLSYINSWHCNGFYGPKFTVNDKLIDLKELENLYHFLKFSYKVLLNGGANVDQDFSRCGFFRVNNDSLIPYAVLSDGEKGVPLFYFEGHIDILKAKAMAMEQGSWELAYLKICCKVQGVRKDLMSGDTVQIVRLADIKGFFHKASIFVDNCWPPKGKSLIPKLNSLNNGYQPSSSSSSSNQNLQQ